MKRILTLLFSLCLSVISISQNGPRWSPAGNTASIGDFLGTLNSIDLPIRTNNTTRFTFKSNGDIIFNSLSGLATNNYLKIDQNGKLIADDAINMGLFQRSGSDYYITSGNLGVGLIPNSSYKLDVLGDARISNNLFVGGGVVITNKVDASIEVKAGNVLVSNDIDVTGNSKVSGILTSPNGFMVDNSSGFKFTSGATPGSGTFQLGKIQPYAAPCAAAAQPGLNFGIGANLQIYDQFNPTTSGILNLQTWPIGCSIDASVGSVTGNQGLLLNYFCGNHTFINTGSNGGDVYVGGLGTAYLTKTVVKTSNINALDVVDPNNSNKVNFRVKTNGLTYCREVNVQLSNFPDFVFDTEYKLMPLKELDSYIKSNGHLPDVPTAKEIDKNGADLGQLVKTQMQKIEELTLYVIELQKKIEILEKK